MAHDGFCVMWAHVHRLNRRVQFAVYLYLGLTVRYCPHERKASNLWQRRPLNPTVYQVTGGLPAIGFLHADNNIWECDLRQRRFEATLICKKHKA